MPEDYKCRCDCVSCVTGDHAGCYYNDPGGWPECGLVEPIAQAIHRCYFKEGDTSPRIEELYDESKRLMISMAKAAITAYEKGVKEERLQAGR